MPISTGQHLPDAEFRIAAPEGVQIARTQDVFGGGRIVLVGMPGAFTPTCSNSHLPGFLDNRDAILQRGVDAIAVLAVNDHHVMKAWARAAGAEGRMMFLADGNGDFTRALGMEADMSASGMGLRCRRFSMLVEDGFARFVNIEEARGQVTMSGAARMLEELNRLSA